MLRDFDSSLGWAGAQRAKEVKSNITENESAKMTPSKGAIQGYNGLAAVDRKHQINVDAQAFGEGQEHQNRNRSRNRFNRTTAGPGFAKTYSRADTSRSSPRTRGLRVNRICSISASMVSMRLSPIVYFEAGPPSLKISSTNTASGINKGRNRFSLRPKAKVQGQWRLHCMFHDIEKLANYGCLTG